MEQTRKEEIYLDAEGNKTDKEHAVEVVIRIFNESGALIGHRIEAVENETPKIDQGRFGEKQAANIPESQKPKTPQTSETWTCPNDETVNVGEVCVICGHSRPMSKEVSPPNSRDGERLSLNQSNNTASKHKKRKILSIIAACLLVATICAAGLFLYVRNAGQPDDFFTYERNGTGITITGIKDEQPTHVEIPKRINGEYVTVIGDNAFRECGNLRSITIPDSVTRIGGEAFRECTNLRRITIPNGVTSIEVGTFFGCTKLTGITIPDSVTIIDGFAFSGCESLVNINIPDSVTSIGALAFTECTSLNSVIIPDSVTDIGLWAFPENCKVLRN